MKKYLFLVLTFFCVFITHLYSQISYAEPENIPPTIDHSKLNEIGVLLNHQSFTVAKERGDALFSSTSKEDILKTSHEDFLTIINLYLWENNSMTAKDLIEKRWNLFPYEKNLCSLSVRYYGYSHPCLGSSSGATFIDSIDYVGYLIQSGTETNQKLEKYMKSLIPRALTLQDKSDLGNLLGYYVKKYPKRSNVFVPKQRKLGKEILKNNPAWVNGYLLLGAGYGSSSNAGKKIKNDLKKNYVGDQDRLTQILGE